MDTVVYPVPRLYDWRSFNGDLARRDAIAALALAMWERGRDEAEGLLNDGEEIRGDEADLVVEDIVGRFVTRWKGGTLGGVPSMKAELRKALRSANARLAEVTREEAEQRKNAWQLLDEATRLRTAAESARDFLVDDQCQVTAAIDALTAALTEKVDK